MRQLTLRYLFYDSFFYNDSVHYHYNLTIVLVTVTLQQHA